LQSGAALNKNARVMRALLLTLLISVPTLAFSSARESSEIFDPKILGDIESLGRRSDAEIMALSLRLSKIIPAYLAKSRTQFSRVRMGKFSEFEIRPIETGSWLNRIAATMHRHDFVLRISPTILIEQSFGNYVSNGRVLRIVMPPFGNTFGEILAHEIFHGIILDLTKINAIPHLQNGFIQRPKSFSGIYDHFYLSEFGAHAESLNALALTYDEKNGYHRQGIPRVLFYLDEFSDQTVEILEQLKAEVDTAARPSRSAKLIRKGKNPYFGIGYTSPDSTYIELHDFILREGMDVDAWARKYPRRTRNLSIHSLSLRDRAQVAQNLDTLLALHRHLRAEIQLLNKASLGKILVDPGRLKKSLENANSLWLQKLKVPPDNEAYGFEAGFKELLACARHGDEHCLALPEISGCEGLLTNVK